MDLNQDNSIGNNEIVEYAWNGTDSLSRVANCDNSHPEQNSFLGISADAALAGANSVRIVNADATNPIKNGNNVPAVFRFYDKDGAELFIDTTTNTNTNRIPDITRIDILLGAESQDVDPSTNQKKRMIYSTSALVRNHVLQNN